MKKLINIIKKKWLINGTKTFLLVFILVALYLGLNIWIQSIPVAQIDFTKNKLYTLSEASKKAISNINDNIKVYLWGYEEKSPMGDLIKQYHLANPNIELEILTQTSNPKKVAEFDLEEGYSIVIIENGDSRKLLDGQYDLYEYDYTTGDSVDISEQAVTNAILTLTEENKPKVYVLTQHNEYTLDEMGTVFKLLENEVYDYEELNLLTAEKVPDDCNILGIFSPTKDFTESEADKIKDYINKGGELFICKDVDFTETDMPVFQSILDLYGVSTAKGYVIETSSSKMVSSYPNIIIPELSYSHEITSSIYSSKSNQIYLLYAGKLDFKDDDTLSNLKVVKEDLVTSSEESLYISNLNAQTQEKSLENAEEGKYTIGAILTKTIENDEESKTSKLVIIANNVFTADYIIEAISNKYPISYMGSNKDLFLNSIAYLTERENVLTIRKNIATTAYTSSEEENNVVKVIIFTVPVLVIVAGIGIWYKRKRKL